MAQRAPEPLHLAARRRVAWARVDQRDAEPLAREAQRFAAVRRAIVEVQRVGRALTAQRTEEDAEHVVLSLAVMRFERDDEA